MMTYSPEFELKHMIESVAECYDTIKDGLRWMAETKLIEKFEDTPREIMNTFRHLRAAHDELVLLYERYGVRVDATPPALTSDNKEIMG